MPIPPFVDQILFETRFTAASSADKEIASKWYEWAVLDFDIWNSVNGTELNIFSALCVGTIWMPILILLNIVSEI